MHPLKSVEGEWSPVVAGVRAIRLAVERALSVMDWHRTHHGIPVVDDD